MKYKLKVNVKGFTLIELMTVMAIIAILATSIMVALSVHKQRAEAGKILTELSGAMQNIYLCQSDDGVVLNPVGGGNICSGLTNAGEYGSWPDLRNTSFVEYDSGSDLSTSPWKYSTTNTNGEVICCNSKYGRC